MTFTIPRECPEWKSQTGPSECTVEELKGLRRFPCYTVQQKLLQVVLFLILGPPKIVLCLAFAIVSGALYILLVNIWRLFGRPGAFRNFLRSWWSGMARTIMFIFGIHRIHWHSSVDSSTRFLVANHVCFFDGWLFTPWWPRILAKREMLKLPLMRENADVYMAIPVDRGRASGTTQLLIESANDPKMPLILILPEGASTSGDYMLRFRTGAFLSDLPVQPVAIRYTVYGTSRNLSHVSFFHHQLYQWVVFLGIITAKVDMFFFEPMTIKAFADDPRKFADAAELKIANHLGVRVIDRSSKDLFSGDEPKKSK
jgi:1-acyl-sn-glycerol-3-phosphate acyltransferase